MLGSIRGASARERWLWFLLFGVPVAALAGCVAVFVACVAVAPADWPGGVAVVIGMLFGGPAVGILQTARRPLPAEEPGVAVGRDEEPVLWALVAEVAAALGDPPPRTIELTLDDDARVRGDVLRVGVALLARDVVVVRGVVGAALVRARRPEIERMLAVVDPHVFTRRSGAFRWLVLGWSQWAWAVERAYGRLAAGEEPRVRGPVGSALGTGELAALVRHDEQAHWFDRYWEHDVVTCLDAGFLPPVVEGWRRVLAAAEEGPAAPVGVVMLDAAGEALIRRRPGGEALVALPWERAGRAVWLDVLLRDATGVEVPDARLADLPSVLDGADDEMAFAVGAGMVFALAEEGWDVAKVPAGPIVLDRDEVRIDPFGAVHVLAADADGWRAFVEDEGIADVSLRRPTPAGESTTALPTAVAPGARVELRVARDRRERRAVVALAAVGLVLCFGLAAGSTFAADSAVRDVPVALAFMWTMAVAVAVLAVWRLRPMVARGRVTFDADGVHIEDAGLLRAGWSVDRGAVRVATVDDSGGEWRFPAGRDEWLWSREGDGVFFPRLGSKNQAPNLLLVFDGVQPAPRARGAALHGPLGDERIRALALTVEDPGAARRAVGPWALAAMPTRADLLAMRDAALAEADDAPGRLRVRRERRLRDGWGLVAAGLLIPPFALVGAVRGLTVRRDDPRQGTLIAVGGLAVFVLRMALWMG